MDKRRGQVAQNRFGITFTEVLIVVESGGRGGGGGPGGDLILAIFENRCRLSLYRNNQMLYGQMELTGGFSGQNWSGNHSPRSC